MEFGTQRILVTGGIGCLGRGRVHASPDGALGGRVELLTGEVRDARDRFRGEMNEAIARPIDCAGRDLGCAPTVPLEEGMRRTLRCVFAHQGGIEG